MKQAVNRDMLANSSVVGKLLASQEGLGYVDLFSQLRATSEGSGSERWESLPCTQ
jgi:hypothetical protein